ncbi:hypothetical protein [Vallitalea okinawensis]|uniref:hypothetical protein n=1 Tax=Vallitalea okinawensis TaxID=2078660 RepID=UPI001300819C|nr:hypothetical protein [Vallitalea okinawensis]
MKKIWSDNMEWSELYNRKSKPRIAEIKAYMSPDAFEAFERFNEKLLNDYNLGYVLPRYNKQKGWFYSYGRSGYILIKEVTFNSDYFSVEDIHIHNVDNLSKAIDLVDTKFHDGFLVRYAEFCEARRKRMKENRLQKSKSTELKYKRNCKWCPKVSRSDIKRLYNSDTKGMLDQELLEEVGLAIYVRCKTSKEIFDLMEQGKIKCLACGEILSGEGELTCKCGLKYTYHAYRKSYRENNMPSGAATPIFNKFVKNWDIARSSQVKMLLIDNLIHEFHVSEISGTRGRPVGVNLIQGTKSQIVKLLCDLASGNV